MEHSSLEETANEFDQWANNGRAESMADGHWGAASQLLDMLPKIAFTGRILDIGCGNGWLVRHCLKRGFSSGIGIDISPKMIDVASQNIEFETNETYIVANAEYTKLSENSIDLCTNIESLYYYPNPKQALREWFRITKKGGFLAIMIDLYQENPATHNWIDALDISVHLLSKSQLKKDLEGLGWKNIEMKQVQDDRPIKTEDEFIASKFWPSYEQYVSYRETGSLCIIAQK